MNLELQCPHCGAEYNVEIIEESVEGDEAIYCLFCGGDFNEDPLIIPDFDE